MSNIAPDGIESILQTICVIIFRLGVLVQLFFIISAFGMCCGYYEKIKNNSITIEAFYRKRYSKILPFFAMLVLIDIIVSGFKVNNIIEGFADVTLLFGFLPNSYITVIGVGWTLGVIFAFYVIFPFFVFLLGNKKRAWTFLGISIILAYLCDYYFLADGRVVSCNLIRWLCFFTAGGLIYLYRDTIENKVEKHKVIFGTLVVILVFIWHFNKINGISIMINLSLFSIIVCYAISVKSKVLNNRITKFVSKISFEIYLSHMFIFRIVEKLGLIHIVENDFLSYCFASVIVIIGTVVFSTVMQKCIDLVKKSCLRSSY